MDEKKSKAAQSAQFSTHDENDRRKKGKQHHSRRREEKVKNDGVVQALSACLH